MDIIKAVFIVAIVLILAVVGVRIVDLLYGPSPPLIVTETVMVTDTIIKYEPAEFGAKLEDGTMLRQCGVTGDNYIQVCWREQRYTLMISGMACNIPKHLLGEPKAMKDRWSFYRTMGCKP